MDFIDDFFVFPQAVDIEGELTLNIQDSEYTIAFRDISHTFQLTSLQPNSTLLLLFDEPSNSFLQVDNWQDVVSEAGLSSLEALHKIRRPNFIQIDHTRGKYFTKVFLPAKQLILKSDTHDFGLYSHFPISYLHPVDWQYQISMDILSAELIGKNVKLLIDVVPPVTTSEAMFLRYGEHSVQVAAGKNQLSFPYKKDELLYLGNTPNCKSIGNSYRLEVYL